ncbi:MAG TPA: cell division protein FtsA [Candidatus Saccharimonadales bacterium]|nr:cell division protein FtsA [Candidatus Saccharimonadales bacterium]
MTNQRNLLATNRAENVYIGLDIGSTKVCCIVGLQEEDAAQPSVIGVGVAPTSGMRKGVVVDIEETVSAITAAVDEAERISGVPIDRATISIDGAHVESINSKGEIVVGRADQEISIDDIRRAEEHASTVQLPPNREIIQVFPRSFTVDGQDNIKDPVGMNGIKLEVEAHIVTGSTPAIKNLHRSIYQAGIDVESQVLVPLAAASAVLTKKQKELGVAVVDIGGGTTGVAVYEEGEVLYSSILPVGAMHITNDIAIGLRTDIEVAEKIKLKYVKATTAKVNPNEKLKIEELGNESVVAKKDLYGIARARLEEILHMVRSEFKKIGKDGMLPGGVVLTGGGANLPGIEDVAKDLLKLPVLIGRPEGLSGLSEKVSDPAYAAPVGLMLENMTVAPLHTADKANVRIGQTVDRLRKSIKKFLP